MLLPALALICLGASIVSSSGNTGGDLVDRIPLTYSGHMSWSHSDILQKIEISIEKPQIDEEGFLIARGRELYWAVERAFPIEVRVKIDPRTGRVEIQEIPSSHPFNDWPPPLVGMLSRDLQEIWGIEDDMADQSIDFRFYSERAEPP